MRQDPDMWIAAAWHKVYNFPICGEDMVTRGEKFMEGKSIHPPHSKDRYPLPDCKDLRARRMLEFLIPILYPEKPARVTITIGNTIFGAYTSERVVDWALVVKDIVRRLLTGIGKSKSTSICPYLLHLYYIHNAIQPKDKKVYMVGESFMWHNIELDEEKQPARTQDPNCKSLSSGVIARLQA